MKHTINAKNQKLGNSKKSKMFNTPRKCFVGVFVFFGFLKCSSCLTKGFVFALVLRKCCFLFAVQRDFVFLLYYKRVFVSSSLTKRFVFLFPPKGFLFPFVLQLDFCFLLSHKRILSTFRKFENL